MEPHSCPSGGPALGPPVNEFFAGPLSPSEYPPLPTCGLQQNPVAPGVLGPPQWGPPGAATWGHSPYGSIWGPSCCIIRNEGILSPLTAPHDAHIKHQGQHTPEAPNRESLNFESVGVSGGRQTKAKSARNALSPQRGQRTRQQPQRKKNQQHQQVALRQQPSQQQTQQWGQQAMRRVWVATSTPRKTQQAGEMTGSEYPLWCSREAPLPEATSELFPTSKTFCGFCRCFVMVKCSPVPVLETIFRVCNPAVLDAP